MHTSRKELQKSSLKRLLSAHLSDIDKIVIVSVVPEFLRILKKSLDSIMPGVAIKIVGRNIKVPVKVNYKKPKEVGQDRLVIAFAGRARYGKPLVVIDFGTAVTFDYINGKGEYEGGVIFPGLRLGLKALSENTALLPKIEPGYLKGLLGKDTKSSMNKGVVLGYAAMCDGLIEKFKERYGKNVKVVATGGDAALISRYSRHLSTISEDLIFHGLMALDK